MDFKAVFLTTSGRISRQTWWIGVIALGLAGAALTAVIGVTGIFATPATSAWGTLLINLILLYPGYCLGIKRRRDRGNNGLDFKIMLAAQLLFQVFDLLRFGIAMNDLGNGVLVPTFTNWMLALFALMSIYAFYLFVQLGFMRGTEGTNSYGADPLAETAAA